MNYLRRGCAPPFLYLEIPHLTRSSPSPPSAPSCCPSIVITPKASHGITRHFCDIRNATKNHPWHLLSWWVGRNIPSWTKLFVKLIQAGSCMIPLPRANLYIDTYIYIYVYTWLYGYVHIYIYVYVCIYIISICIICYKLGNHHLTLHHILL